MVATLVIEASLSSFGSLTAAATDVQSSAVIEVR